MPTKRIHLLAALVLALPAAAAAQTQHQARSEDADYCKALARKYSSLRPIFAAATAKDALMAANCDNDPASSIAALEEAMKDARIELPPRQEFAAGHQQ